MMTLAESLSFSAAHYYFRPDWSEEQNRAQFGACANDFGHGHDYRLEVEIRTNLDTFDEDQNHLRELLARLFEELDHRHLNHHIPLFRDGGQVPTSENIALYLRERLLTLSPGLPVTALRIFERPDLWVELSL